MEATVLIACVLAGCVHDAVPTSREQADLAAPADLADRCRSPHCCSDEDCETPQGIRVTCNPVRHLCLGPHECLPAAGFDCDPGSTCLQLGGIWTCVVNCPRGTNAECPAGLNCCGPLFVCVESARDVNHCGGCGHSCDPVANGVPGCTAGVCSIHTCNPGFDDCDHNPVNGCEASLSSDATNCGSCGHECGPGNTCQQGRCL